MNPAHYYYYEPILVLIPTPGRLPKIGDTEEKRRLPAGKGLHEYN